MLCQWPVCPVGDTDGLSKHAHAKSLQGVETAVFAVFFFFYQRTITWYDKHIEEERGPFVPVHQHPLLGHYLSHAVL